MAKINKIVPGSIKIRTMKNGNQYIYLRALGGKKFVATGLENTRENILKAEQILKYAYIENKKLEQLEQISPTAPTNNFYKYFEEYIEFKRYKGITANTIYSFKHTFGIYFPNDFDINAMYQTTGRKMSLLEHFVYTKTAEIRNKYSPNYINKCLSQIGSFIKYCVDEDIIDKYIKINKYLLPTISKKIQIYSEQEITIIYWKILASDYPKKREFALWFLFLLYTGSRRSESTELKWSDVNFSTKYIEFPNKKNKNKVDYFPITAKLMKLLLILKKDAVNYKNRKEYLFSLTSQPFAFNLLKILKECNLKQKGRFIHSFRKTFATKLYDLRDSNMIDGAMITELTRHKDKRLTDDAYRKYNSENIINMLNKAGL